MRKLTGIGASEGIAVARLWRIRPTELTVSPEAGKDPLREGERFAAAQEKAIAELSVLYEEAALADPETAMIFDVHRMMLEDPDFCDGVAGTIAEGSSAEWAVTQSARLLREMFESMEDEYMRGRAADIQDVSLRVIRILRGVDEAKTKLTENVIVTAEDLLPSQTVKLDKEHVEQVEDLDSVGDAIIVKIMDNIIKNINNLYFLKKVFSFFSYNLLNIVISFLI